MIKKRLKSIADKLFSRSRILRIENEVVAATRRLSHIDQDVEGTATLLDKKMQYLIAKLDAYADAADAIDEQMRKEAEQRHDALTARLEAVEAGYIASMPSLGETFVASTRSIETALVQLQADRQADMAALNEALAQQAASTEIRHVAVEAGVTASISTVSERVVENQQAISAFARDTEAMRKTMIEQFASVDAHLHTVEAREERLLKAVAALKSGKPAQADGRDLARIVPAAQGAATLRVEVLGPSGVGKSTILDATRALRTPVGFWHDPDEIDAALNAIRADRQAQRAALDEFSPKGFVSRCLELVSASDMLPSQKLSAYAQFRGTCQTAAEVRDLSSSNPLVHDELLLHRASSLLLYSDSFADHAAWYFDTVPAPDGAIVIIADRDAIVERVKERKTQQINTYYGLEGDRLGLIVDRNIALSRIAHERLGARGVKVMLLDASQSVEQSAIAMQGFIAALGTARPDTVSSDGENTQ